MQNIKTLTNFGLAFIEKKNAGAKRTLVGDREVGLDYQVRW